jgi:hypothetical protein
VLPHDPPLKEGDSIPLVLSSSDKPTAANTFATKILFSRLKEVYMQIFWKPLSEPAGYPR